MLWYKTWLETRWRFLIGLAVLLCSAAGVVLEYPHVQQLVDRLHPVGLTGEIGRRVQEAVDLSRNFRGYVWSQAFRQNLAQMGTLFAVLLGTGGFLQSSKGAALFTLSLPISRRELLRVRALAALGQWLVLAVLPALLIAVLAPAIGERFGLGAALVHGLCLFVAGAAFLSLAVWLSTIFGDLWRPLLIALLVAVVLALPELVFPDLSRFSLFRVMSGESFFRSGHLPWLGLAAAAALSATFLYGASRNFARRDF